MKLIVVVIILAGIVGCAEQKTHDPILVGTWQDSFLFIESADVPETDPSWEYFVATPGNWDRAMGAKPTRTTFKNDGTFSAEHRDLRDSVFVVATGTWHTTGDSLYFFQWAPDTFIASFQFAVVQDTLKFNGVVDWERDGKRNDKVTINHVRWPRPDSLAGQQEKPRKVH